MLIETFSARLEHGSPFRFSRLVGGAISRLFYKFFAGFAFPDRKIKFWYLLAVKNVNIEEGACNTNTNNTRTI